MVEKLNENNHVLSVWDRIRSGDEHAFSNLFLQYYSDLFHYGINIFNLPDLVKDSIQDVFSRVWEKRESLGEARNPKAYLIASLRRRLFLNKELYHIELTDDLVRNEEKDRFSFNLSDFMETEELSTQLRQSLVLALNSLSVKQRELVLLRFYYRLKYLEIAEIMAVNEQTVRNLMHRTILKLREKIDFGLQEGIEYVDGIILALFFLGKK